MPRRLPLFLAVAAVLVVAAPALASFKSGTYSGPHVGFSATHSEVRSFHIRLDYVCGPQGKQHVTQTLKVSGIAIHPDGTFHFHLENGPLVLTVNGKLHGTTATGTADGFGDIGAGSSDCGTGKVHWSATHR